MLVLKLKLKTFVGFIFLLSTYALFSQTGQTLKLISSDQYKQSEIISSVDTMSSGKVMACAGNAANDLWINAIALAVNGPTVAGTTCGTMEVGETKACNTSATNSVWYKFTATATTHYVKIWYTSGGCYFGSAIYGNLLLPVSACGNSGPISCQAASGGPLDHLYQLTNLTISNTYYIQIVYGPGGVCGQNGTFNIGVTTANPGGTITNPAFVNTCATPQAGCFFGSPPAINTITSTCTSYPLAAAGYSANSVFTVFQQFTSSASWSNFSWQAIITSNCGGGNVVWLNWALYNCACGELACGDIATLTGNGLACGTCYIIKYQFELANCSSFTTVWPYQNVPTSPVACTVLPLELLYFTANYSEDKFVNIDWETASEKNLDHYNLERSSDGAVYESIAKTQAVATKGGGAKYAYQDKAKLQNGTYYYRLSAIEKDGSEHFNKIIAVTIEDGKEIIRFAPNPAENNFDIIFGINSLNLETKMEVFNSFGQKVKEENFTPKENIRSIDISDLRPGLYYVNINTPASSETIKQTLIKQ